MQALVAIIGAVAAMAGIISARYVVASGGFAWLTRRRIPGAYDDRAAQIRSEIRWSLASCCIYAAPAGALAWAWQAQGWTRLYVDPGAHPRWWLVAAPLLYLLIHDCWFYWTHRLMHRPFAFRIAHAVHHASNRPTAWTSMSFHPIEAAVGAVIVPLLVLTVPIHVAGLGFVLAVMTIMGVTNHMGWEIFPAGLVRGPLGRWLITASHHERHHRDYRCNYGLYFRFWDRLAGTDRGIAGDFGHRRRVASDWSE